METSFYLSSNLHFFDKIKIFLGLNYLSPNSPNMVKYAKKLILKKYNFKILFSTLTLKKILKTYLNYILRS